MISLEKLKILAPLQKLPNIFYFAKVMKFRQIWSHWMGLTSYHEAKTIEPSISVDSAYLLKHKFEPLLFTKYW